MRPDGIIKGHPWPLIGVIHLEALPGSPNWGGNWAMVREAAKRDAEAFAEGGVDAVIVENYGDVPFTGGRVPSATVAAMAVLAESLKEHFKGPMGINVLRNDGRSAIALAAATGADFVRINVLVGAMVTDQGVIEGDAWNVLRDRRELAPECQVWADVMVKHAVPIGEPRLEDLADDTFHRAGADALILSGVATGAPARPADFQVARRRVPEAPLVVGSGLTMESLPTMMAVASGAIVATSLKRDGFLDPAKIRHMVEARNALLDRAVSRS